MTTYKYWMIAAIGAIAGFGASSIFWYFAPTRHHAPVERSPSTTSRQPVALTPPAAVVSHVSTVDGAERCAEGMVRGDLTAGRCCWLGQWWSREQAACIGVPFRCPDGHVARGHACVAAPEFTRPQDVTATMVLQRAAIRRCAAEQNPGRFRGDVSLGWMIDVDGQVFSLHLDGASSRASIEHPELVTCLERVIRGATFPAARTLTRVSRFDVRIDAP